MEYKEFEEAYELGVQSEGVGIADPTVFGVETVLEAKQKLYETTLTPLRASTYIYEVGGIPSHKTLVGINAKSKKNADGIIKCKRSAAVQFNYVGELNEVMGGDDDKHYS